MSLLCRALPGIACSDAPYAEQGAVAMDEWTVQRLTGDALKTFAES
jgi:hypothetical protein